MSACYYDEHMVQFNDDFSNAKMLGLRTQEEERLVQTMAPQYGFEYINLKGYTINPEALTIIPMSMAKAAEAAGFEINQKTFSVAVKNPNSPRVNELVDYLQAKRYTVVIYMCSSQSLKHAWERYDDVTSSTAEKKGVFEINTEDIKRLTDRIKDKSDVLAILKEINGVSNTRRISETLELIFAGGLALRASDIHIEPEETGVRLRYRFDGVLHDIVDLDSYIFARLMSRLKLLSGMVLNTRAEAQDGRFTFDVGEREIEVRSSIIPGAIGESIVMRLLDPSVASFTMDKIKLNKWIESALCNN